MVKDILSLYMFPNIGNTSFLTGEIIDSPMCCNYLGLVFISEILIASLRIADKENCMTCTCL